MAFIPPSSQLVDLGRDCGVASLGDFQSKLPNHAGKVGGGISGEFGDQIGVRLLDRPAGADESIDQ